MPDDIYESSVRSAGDWGAVFEVEYEDGPRTSYFYLLNMHAPEGKGVTGHIHITSRHFDFAQADIRVDWDPEERFVGLFIREQLWAAFDVAERLTYGGDYSPAMESTVPPHVKQRFVGH